MKKIINAVKIGNIVNISISGKLHKKNCGSPEEANELFKLVLIAKENPTDENIKKVRTYLNEKTRIAMMAGLEADSDTGEVYLAGFNTPIPMVLIETIKEYHENGYPLDAIINFWKLLMINPDVRVRTSLFDFISAHDFVLTDKGYMVVYKAVYRKDNEGNKQEREFEEFVTNQALRVRKEWKCSANKYVVYRDFEKSYDEEGEINEVNYEDFTYQITKVETAEGWNEKEKGIEILGKLGDLFSAIVNSEDKESTEETAKYTDMYSRTMNIELGVPVHMPRHSVDSDPQTDCSHGLHCGATKYVQTYASHDSIILVCLVNPANVVAVPTADCCKMRTSEYFPYAMATYTDGKIDIIESPYYEEEYMEYEIEELENQIALIKANELPIETAINAEEETRPMTELMKMIESRIVDLEDMIED
jgi:hypothetical protein